MSCECDCASCTEFCDCQRCSKPETNLLEAPRNRPGLDTIRTRIGDYGAFFTDAKRRLATTKEPLDKLIPQARHERNHQVTVRPEPVEGINQRFPKESPNLQALGTRDPSDPTIALLDAWSVTADVLTFYRERLTQEAYLRTATDEGSLRELANLVGFKPRPGIAATTHLAYLLDPSAKPVDINPGAKAQTVPLPGEKMQTFETEEKLSARAEWSQMKPRQNRPSSIDILDALTRPTIRLTDLSLFVRPGERVLFVFGMKLGYQVVREVLSAKTNIELGFVELILKPKDDLVKALKKSTEKTNLVQQILNERDEIADRMRTASNNIRLPLLLLSNILSSYLLGMDAIGTFDLLSTKLTNLTRPADEGGQFFGFFKPDDPPTDDQEIVLGLAKKLLNIFEKIARPNSLPSFDNESKATSLDDFLSSLERSPTANLKSGGEDLPLSAKQGFESEGVVRIGLAQAMKPALQGVLESALAAMPANSVPNDEPSVYLLRTVASPFGAVAPQKIANLGERFAFDEWELDPLDTHPGLAFLDNIVDAITADSFAIIDTPWFDDSKFAGPYRLLRFARVRSTQTIGRGVYNISGKITQMELADADIGGPFTVAKS